METSKNVFTKTAAVAPCVVVDKMKGKRRSGYTAVPCDRKTCLGNPFPMGTDGHDERYRDAVCDAYARLLQQLLSQPQAVDVHRIAAEFGLRVDSRFLSFDAPRVLAELQSLAHRVAEGEHLQLLCWCRPKRCHAESIAAALLQMSTSPITPTVPSLHTAQPGNATAVAKKRHYYVVLDFEATCQKDVRPRNPAFDGSKKDQDFAADQEVIELPSVLVTSDGELVSPPNFGGPAEGGGEFQRYVRPAIHPNLSDFCTELTKIRQEQVDAAPDFTTAMRGYEQWLRMNGMLQGGEGASFTIVTCGDWDLKTMMPKQCYVSGLKVPAWATVWVNIKTVFKRLNYERGGGMMAMLQSMKIKHQGTHHSGIDDCRNIALILQRILRDGAWDGQPTGGSRECEGFHSPGIISAAKAVPRKTEQAQGQGPMKAPAAQLLGGDDKEKEMKKLQKKRNQRNDLGS